MVAAYLIDRCGLRCDNAISIIRETRPVACPNIGFIGVLKQLERERSGHQEGDDIVDVDVDVAGDSGNGNGNEVV